MAQVKEFNLPDDQYYDRKDHIWARLEGKLVRVGLDQLGACVAGTVAHLKLLPVGREVKKGQSFGTMEAGKYVGPLKAPVSGKITSVNQELLGNPKVINTDYYGKGWFVVIDPVSLEPDLADLAHGNQVLPWLYAEVEEYEKKAMIKPEEAQYMTGSDMFHFSASEQKEMFKPQTQTRCK